MKRQVDGKPPSSLRKFYVPDHEEEVMAEQQIERDWRSTPEERRIKPTGFDREFRARKHEAGMLLVPQTCNKCGKEYYEVGYWGDYAWCPHCAQEEKQRIDSAYSLKLPREAPPKYAGNGRRWMKYKQEYCELIIEAASRGESEVEFASNIKVSMNTLNKWSMTHKRFQAAREIAHQQSQAWYERIVRFGMLDRIKVNSTLAMWYGKNKMGWRDKSEQDIAVSAHMPLVEVVDKSSDFPCELVEPEAQ
jgi:hypothetical protein